MNKINRIKLSKHFYLNEFQCNCCNQVILHSDLLKRLVSLRGSINRPIYINSGYRCKKENIKVGGVKNSYHRVGMAVDIRSKGISISELAIYAEGIGFKGIGIYKTYLHLDIRDKKYIWEE